AGGEERAEVVHEPGPAELPVLHDARLAAASAEPGDDRARGRGRGRAAAEGQEHAHGAGAGRSGARGSGPGGSGPSMAAIRSRLTQPMTAPSWPVTVTRVAPSVSMRDSASRSVVPAGASGSLVPDQGSSSRSFSVHTLS